MTTDTAKLPESLARIVQRFQRQSDPKRRYELLLWYAKQLAEFPEVDRVPENKVPGCVSQVYINAICDNERVWFRGDSDSQLVKGLVGLLILGLNGLTPNEILQVTPDFIEDTGLNMNLTPSRTNGFYNIFQTIRRKVLEFCT
ncbi:MAG: SufE family protein [Cyanosarcina radialis HA8281-LM2]|nr:SufE family protein [Cyanosarcina radialis HA8281-LM2]